MRYLLFGLLISGWFMACQSDPSGNNQNQSEANNAPVEEESQEPIYAGNATTASPDGVPQANKNGSFMKPMALPNSETVDILNRDFWVMEFYVADERDVRLGNKGRWFRFYKDGTFENGRWTKKLGYGAWNLQNVPGQGLTLILDNIDDTQDQQWEIQGVNQSGDTMTWVGINKADNAGHVVKAINLLTRPTRKQFDAEGIQ